MCIPSPSCSQTTWLFRDNFFIVQFLPFEFSARVFITSPWCRCTHRDYRRFRVPQIFFVWHLIIIMRIPHKRSSFRCAMVFALLRFYGVFLCDVIDSGSYGMPYGSGMPDGRMLCGSSLNIQGRWCHPGHDERIWPTFRLGFPFSIRQILFNQLGCCRFSSASGFPSLLGCCSYVRFPQSMMSTDSGSH